MPKRNCSYTHQTDLELFDLVRQDDVQAFEEIYHRYWSVLIDLVYKRLQSRQKAEDLVQDIFVSLYQKRYALQLTVSLKAYLYQAAKFRVLNVFRDEYTRQYCNKEIAARQAAPADIAERLESKETLHRMEQLVEELPEKCRMAFLLSRKEELSHKDISANMQISVSTVEKHIGKALKILRNNLGDYPVSC